MATEQGNKQICPFCGAALPAEASFCPYCARSVNRRQEVSPPSVRWRRALRRALAVLACLLLAGTGAALYQSTRPQAYDAAGEIYYANSTGSYHLFLSDSGEEREPLAQDRITAAVDEAYRMPVLLYIRDARTGADAAEAFLKQADRVTAELPTQEGSGGNFACTAPAPHSAFPGVPLVSLLDFTIDTDAAAQMVWTITMKSGDTIRLRQEIVVSAVRTYDYYPADAPMGTTEELQALVDELSASLPPSAVLNIHLPAVTYPGELVIRSRAVNLLGSAEGDRRTTFTGSVTYEAGAGGGISYVQDILFQGDGTGTALSAASRLMVENCTFRDWAVGLYGGESWVNAIGCTFAGNGVGFHFNSTGKVVNHSLYNGNTFQNNGTAVLLESVPTEVVLNFRDSVFSGNGMDIDNWCDHPIDLSQAIFQ